MARQKEDVTFAEAQGLESNVHAKKIAKEKAKKDKKKYETFYSKKGTKVVKFTIKPNGIYNEYIGNLAKKTDKQYLTPEIEKWKKESLWVEEHAVKEFCAKKLAALT